MRSSATCRRNTGKTRSRRSLPSVRFRPAACCATSVGSCKCHTGRSIGCANWCRKMRSIRFAVARGLQTRFILNGPTERNRIERRVFDIAQKLEGLTRHASTHAAGIVIGDRPLTEMVPLYRDPKSLMPVTQFNMKWVEPAGLVKFDFLGLKTLTVLDR